METVSTPEQEHFKLIYLRGLEYKAPVLANFSRQIAKEVAT